MPTTIDLSKFCDPESSRYSIQKPWVKNGYTYATDGRVLVRVDTADEPDTVAEPGSGLRFPKADDILPPLAASESDWLPWPKVEPCETCMASNKIPCIECDGHGECNLCRCKTPHECGNCDGTGSIDCETCTDIGGFSHRFGKAEIALKYAFAISALPDVKYLPQEKPDGVVRFRFDGGEGAVASLYDKGGK